MRKRMYPALWMPVVLALAAAAFGAEEADRTLTLVEHVGFEALAPALDLTTAEETALLLRAQAALTGNALPELPERLQNDRELRVVFLSVSDTQTMAQTTAGQAHGLAAALDQAVARAGAEARPAAAALWIRLDILEEASPYSPIPKSDRTQRPTVPFGLAFPQMGIAFLPEQLAVQRILDDNGYPVLTRIARCLGRPDGILGRNELGTPQQFATRAVFLEGGAAIRLDRGHRRFETITPDAALDAARSGGAYLVRSVDPDGLFAYLYLPATNKTALQYNIVRHAGTTCAMFDLYAVTRDPLLRAAAERSLDALLAAVRPLPMDGVETAIVVESNSVKLGGNALAIVALARHAQATGERRHLAVMRRLAEWIRRTQAEDGRFAVHKMNVLTGETFAFDSQYYPGESVLAMMRLHALDPEGGWLAVAAAGARWLIRVRDADVPTAKLEHDHWLLMALNELHRAQPDPMYLEHTRRLVRAILDTQHLDPNLADWLGGFYVPPRSTPTATRMEGLCAAYALLRDHAPDAELEAMRRAILLGLRFQSQAQFRPERVLFMPDPQRCLGGIHGSLTEYDVRIDYLQHAISAYLSFRRFVANIPDDAATPRAP